jgi:hypothetical protein
MAVRLDTRFEQVEDKVGAILKDVSRSCGLGALIERSGPVNGPREPSGVEWGAAAQEEKRKRKHCATSERSHSRMRYFP